MKVISTNRLNRFWQKGILPIKNALTNKFDKSKILAQREITEAGCVMDGKTASEYFDELNSNLAGKQDSLIAGQFVEGFAGDGTLLMTWSKIGVSKKPSAVIITPCSSQDVIVSYNYDYNTAGTIQLRAYSTASGAAFSGALRFSMLVIQ